MGRIADAVLSLLADGPAGADELGRMLESSGATRSRDPAAAVRRATRDDPRVIQLVDGRLASLAQTLAGVELTTVVTEEEAVTGCLALEPDLAPLAMLGLLAGVPLPPGIAPGEVVAVRVEDPERPAVSVRCIAAAPPRPHDEAALLMEVEGRLSRFRPDRPWVAPPVTHLGAVAALAAACHGALRGPGRPLSAVLAEAGYEVHLGWIGPPGTEWASLTEVEVAALEADVADLLADERPAEAALALDRLLAVLRRHVPERVPAARRRLARTLVRAGRSDDALEVLREAFPEDDPEDRYEAALIAYRTGDEVSARRWVEDGLARCDPAGPSELAACLADIGSDLDAQAAFLRLRAGLPPLEADAASAERVAAALTGLGRSYLVEAMVEEVLATLPPEDLDPFLALLGEADEAGREACLAIAAILPAGGRRPARGAAGRGARSRLAAVAGLANARPAAAWATSPEDAPDQRQVVITVAKENRRLSPLVVLIDVDELGGGVKDAFFLPDMAEPRLRRELLEPMADLGLACEPMDLHEAIALVQDALARTAEIGWTIPSLEHQPVLDRIDRWVVRPQRGTGRRPVGS
jgi:tetratricopeptide (TPR) repeat protein